MAKCKRWETAMECRSRTLAEAEKHEKQLLEEFIRRRDNPTAEERLEDRLSEIEGRLSDIERRFGMNGYDR